MSCLIFMVDKMELGQVSLPVLRFSPVNMIPPVFQTNLCQKIEPRHVENSVLSDIRGALERKVRPHHKSENVGSTGQGKAQHRKYRV